MRDIARLNKFLKNHGLKQPKASYNIRHRFIAEINGRSAVSIILLQHQGEWTNDIFQCRIFNPKNTEAPSLGLLFDSFLCSGLFDEEHFPDLMFTIDLENIQVGACSQITGVKVYHVDSS
jgi:hypothetical protein